MSGQGGTGGRLNDVFAARAVGAGYRSDKLRLAAAQGCGCLGLHRVRWLSARLSADGGQVIWQFRAPDAESVRLVLRNAGIGFGALWVDGPP